MAFPPRNPFMKHTCPACGWREITFMRGDVVFGPKECEKCGCENLMRSVAGPVESMKAFPVEYAKHVMRKL